MGAFQVMKELQSALSTAAADDSKLVLLSAVGSVFCCGLDFIYFIRRLTDDRKRESARMAEAIRYAPLSTGRPAEPAPAAGVSSPEMALAIRSHPCPRGGWLSWTLLLGVSSPEMSDEWGEGSPPGRWPRPSGTHPGPRGHWHEPDPMMGLLP